MRTCPECNAAIGIGRDECPKCGLKIEDLSAETAMLPDGAADDTPTRLESKAGRHDTPTQTTGGSGRFVSGTVLAGRYRIVGLIGKGRKSLLGD